MCRAFYVKTYGFLGVYFQRSDCFIQSRSAADVSGKLQLLYLYFIGGCRRNSSLINPSLTGMNPVSAMWLFWTITKCCFYEYSFSMRLRANAICFRANTIMVYRIIYILLRLKEQKLILLAFPSNIANTIVKSLNMFYGVRA